MSGMTGATRKSTRTAAAGALLLLAATGALSGCSEGPKVVGQITPITASSTPSPGTSTTASPAASSAASPAPTTSPAALVLADTGIGGLHLGQSKKQALATGLIGKLAGPPTDASTGCTVYHGKRGIDLVYFHAGKVMVISVTRSILTDKGVGIGDTYQTLHQNYPDATMDPDSAIDRIYPAAPQAQIEAGYRIAMSSDQDSPDDKILELALQANAQPCYE
jgi:hypothetical protein